MNPVRLQRLTPAGEQWFFGYYDVRAIDRAGQHLAHRVPFRDRLPGARDEAALQVLDLGSGTGRELARTTAWNFQQGSMLQWLGDDSGRLFFNEARPGGGYRGVMLDPKSGARSYTDRALANVSADGRWGLAVDFDRMHDFRPGYGYAEQDDPRADIAHPEDDGIWVCDLASGRSRLALSLGELHRRLRHLSPLNEGKLLVNHLTFNPSGARFVALVRNFPVADPSARPANASQIPGKVWRTTVVTADRDGANLRVLVRAAYASHFHWRDDGVIVFHCDGPHGAQLYEVTDEAHPRFGALDVEFFRRDGHCSYSPDRRWLLYDSYPDERGLQHLYLYDLRRRRGRELGAWPALTVPIADLRCDLHPRWIGPDRITLDSTHEGFRAIYLAELGEAMAES